MRNIFLFSATLSLSSHIMTTAEIWIARTRYCVLVPVHDLKQGFRQNKSASNAVKGHLLTQGHLLYSTTSRRDFHIQMKRRDSFIHDAMTLTGCENSLRRIPVERLPELALAPSANKAVLRNRPLKRTCRRLILIFIALNKCGLTAR